MCILENKISAFLTCKKFNKYGAEGFQRAIGKPFGRARRRETLCACKNYKTCNNNAKYFVNSLRALAILASALKFRLSKNPREVSEGPQPLRLPIVSAGFAGGAGC